MKNRSSLILMEQLIMVMVFALAAALCLQAFVKADGISAQTARQDQAVLIARNAAEALKSGKGADEIAIHDGYRLDILEDETGVPGLARAQIDVYYGAEADPVFSLEAAWQEVAP